jgi:hypothetical protein
MIEVTHKPRSGAGTPVLLNPKYIIRVSVSPHGDTVIEVEGSQYATWCIETPQQVYNLIKDSKND